jgi:hypothetical protein
MNKVGDASGHKNLIQDQLAKVKLSIYGNYYNSEKKEIKEKGI